MVNEIQRCAVVFTTHNLWYPRPQKVVMLLCSELSAAEKEETATKLSCNGGSSNTHTGVMQLRVQIKDIPPPVRFLSSFRCTLAKSKSSVIYVYLSIYLSIHIPECFPSYRQAVQARHQHTHTYTPHAFPHVLPTGSLRKEGTSLTLPHCAGLISALYTPHHSISGPDK